MASAATGRTPPPPPPPGPVRAPFSPGAEVEVLVDDDLYGHWREATVVRFLPARRRGTRSAPDRYEVAYAHLEEGRGRKRPARSRVRPRPPPPASPPHFLLNDAVEAFLNNAWRAGIVVSASPSAVTVAFPVTRKTIEFPPGLVRPRRVYIDGDWVAPSLAAMNQAQAPARVCEVGDKVEVSRRGIRWVSATVARVVPASPVNDLSYVVEYDDDLELEVDGGARKAATELLHWKFIRPAVERLPREMFQLGPGATVEAYCDGAWSPAVVRRVVGEGVFEVSIHGNEAKLLVTDKVRPQYNWDGKQWTIVTAKLIQHRQANLKPWSLHAKGPSRPIDAASSGHEQIHDPGSPTTKRWQQLDAILAENSTPQNESVPKSNEETVDKQVLSEIMVSGCHLNAPLCASAGDILELGKKMLSPNRPIDVASSSDEQSHDPGFPTTKKSRKELQQQDAILADDSTPQNESVPKSNEETVDKQVLFEIMVSDGHLNAPLCVSAGDISELGKKMPSPSRPIDAASSDDEQSHDPGSSTTKKSRKVLQQLDAILADNSTLTPQNESVPKSNEETVDKHVLSEIMVSDGHFNAPLCVSAGDISELGKKMSSPSRPIDAASSGDEQSHNPGPPPTKNSRKELLQLDAILADDSTPQNESVPKSNEEIVDKQVLSDIMVSDGPLNAPLYVSAGHMSELGKKMPSFHRMIRRKREVIFVKLPTVTNDISKNKGGETHPTHELLGENGACDKRQPNLKPQSMHGKGPSRPNDAASSGDEQSHDLGSPTTKNSKKELQQLDAILADNSTRQNESVPKSNEETVDTRVLSEIMVSDGHLNAPVCVSAGDISELGKKMPSSQKMIRRKRKVIFVKLPT